jgi:sulfatase-modifying factor enzyme 1
VIAVLLALAEITNGQYRACVTAKVCRPAAFEDPRSAANLRTGKSENAAAYRKVSGDDQPAVGVSWHDAKTYCAWTRQRLPSVRDLKGAKPKMAIWLADAVGKKRAIRGGNSGKSEDPAARAHWLGFRCVP